MAPVEGAPWTGPSPRDMITSHTLAEEIINRHDDACPVLGPSELVLLQRFVNNPATRNEILRDCNMEDDEGDHPGMKAQRDHGSLAGFVVAKHTDDGTHGPALTEDEIEKLRVWFSSGAADDRMAGARETGRL